MLKEEEKEIIREDTCEAGTMNNSSSKKMKGCYLITKYQGSRSHEDTRSINPFEDEDETHEISIMKMKRKKQKE